jgi:ribulose-phosphate 3-epimerase|tara:strand:+ start:547 stop:1182 length:636 start_codon:yes stop_codon:yes gene_type:complete
MKPLVVPSILVKNKTQLNKQTNSIKNKIKLIQVDIIDNKFAKGKTIKLDQLKDIKNFNYEIHLMVKDPENYIQICKKLKSKIVIFHLEATKDPLDLIKEIKKQKMKVGIALNPQTKPEKVKPFINKVDQILVMTVHPGKQGQKFIKPMLKKIKKLRSWNKNIDIEVDGGINYKTIKESYKSGANKFVIGSLMFKNKQPLKVYKELNKLLKR